MKVKNYFFSNYYFSNLGPLQNGAVWSMLEDNISNENVILNKNALIFKGLASENLGSYECSSTYETILHRIIFSLEKSVDSKNRVIGRTKSYIIESVNSNHNEIPHVRLDFRTSIENIRENSIVEIKCSSSTSKFILIQFLFTYLINFKILIFIENTRIEWFQQNEPLFTDTLLSYNFNSNDLDLFKCIVVKVSDDNSSFGSKNSIGIRFRRKSDRLFNASIELVDINNVNIDHLLDQVDVTDESEPIALNPDEAFVKILLIEPQRLDLVKLNQKVILKCSLLLNEGNKNKKFYT
jgi:hypothetical protein